MRFAPATAFSLVLLAACASRPDAAPASGEPVAVASPVVLPSAASGSSSASAPRPLPREEEGELSVGRRTFRGMVKPIKGGYEVRGVEIDGSALPDALARSAIDGIPSDPDWFLGAVVRVTAEIVKHEFDLKMKDGLAVQGRSGASTSATKLEVAELVTRAEIVEGTLQRSKGFFEVGKYLVRRDDLGWSLASSGGPKEGTRVKLWGQPRIVHCNPDEQCLEGGSLPIFDVGRAEKLP